MPSPPTSYRYINNIVSYLKSKNVDPFYKIRYLQNRNMVAAKAKLEANRQFKVALRNSYKTGKSPTLLQYPHFNENSLNNVKVTNIFKTVSPSLANRYKMYPTIMRILQQPERNSIRNAYGSMLHYYGVPPHIISTIIQKHVGNKTKEKAMLTASKRIGNQSMLRSMRRRTNKKRWENFLGRTHASPKPKK